MFSYEIISYAYLCYAAAALLARRTGCPQSAVVQSRPARRERSAPISPSRWSGGSESSTSAWTLATIAFPWATLRRPAAVTAMTRARRSVPDMRRSTRPARSSASIVTTMVVLSRPIAWASAVCVYSPWSAVASTQWARGETLTASSFAVSSVVNAWLTVASSQPRFSSGRSGWSCGMALARLAHGPGGLYGSTMRLTLPAELALLCFDPATCEWFPTDRKRRQTAFGAAAVYQSAPIPGTARALRRLGKRAERAALIELAGGGVVDGRRLLNRAPLARRYERLVAVLAQGEFEREYDRALIAVLAWADVLEPRLKGRSHHWFRGVMEAVVDEDEEPDRVIAALGLACDGKVAEFLVAEADDLREPVKRDETHVQAQQ